jgi:hypothetical protein
MTKGTVHRGSLWPNATAAWAGLSQLASLAPRPSTAHDASGAARPWLAHAQCAVTMRGVAWRLLAHRRPNGDEVHDTSNPTVEATRHYTDTSMKMAGSGSSPEQWSGRRKLDGTEGGGRCPIGDVVREEVLQLQR